MILVSACLLGCACRYDGQSKPYPLARELAKRIESELEYPGQIKVHVLRETKVVEYAK